MTATAPPVLSAERYGAVLFDMDGVITDTAEAHAAAWKRTFDDYLRRHAQASGSEPLPFDPEDDYRRYVDGKPRYDGVRSFLESRGIRLPEGDPGDDGDRETVHGLGNRKNEYFRQWLEQHRVRTYPSTLALIRLLQELGLKVAAFSSSRNAEQVLSSTGTLKLFDTRVDGRDMSRLGLPGKPDPAILREAARRLGVSPARTVVVEDALSGVEAGARGGFGLVIGIDRTGRANHEEDAGRELRARGADLVVRDLSEIAVDTGEARLRSMDTLPDAWERRGEIRARLGGRPLVVCLDYDGTLTPIVEDYHRAVLSEDMHAALEAVAGRFPTAIISGRDLARLRDLVGLDTLYYAGSHGFEIAGPKGWRHTLRKGAEFLPDLDRAEQDLRRLLADIPGHAVERKAFAIAVHYRQVAPDRVPAVEGAVDAAMQDHPRLRKGYGKCVFQVRPRVDWDKGRALRWILEHLQLPGDVLPLYIGDDLTDEDAFRAIAADGLGIVVGDETRWTAAGYTLADPEAVRRFLRWLAEP